MLILLSPPSFVKPSSLNKVYKLLFFNAFPTALSCIFALDLTSPVRSSDMYAGISCLPTSCKVFTNCCAKLIPARSTNLKKSPPDPLQLFFPLTCSGAYSMFVNQKCFLVSNFPSNAFLL